MAMTATLMHRRTLKILQPSTKEAVLVILMLAL